MRRLAIAAFCVIVFAPAPVLAQQKEKLQGYAEWQFGNVIVVDGQRVRTDGRTKFTDKRWSDIDLGDEIKVEGFRQPDGAILASQVTAKENGPSMFEEESIEQADQAEAEWLEAGQVVDDEDEDAPPMKISTRGRRVDRVRAILDRVMPPYLDPEAFRVYVVESEDWNAFAMANGTIWVHTGLLADMDDDELAVVLGHELAHVTHEHLRKSMKRDMWYTLLQAGVELVSESGTAQAVAGGISLVRQNKYSRDLEDQADRVGLRYSYEAGFDTGKATELWRRFDEKYGSEDKVTNYLLGGHSRAVDRVKKLDQQIAMNYRDGAGGKTRRGSARPTDDRPETETAAPAKSRTGGAKKSRKMPTSAPGSGAAASLSIAESLASLKAQMTTGEVEKILGKPVSVDRDGDTLLWHYADDFDAAFVGGRLQKVRPRQ